MTEFKAMAIYAGAWVLGIIAIGFGMLLLSWLLTSPTDPDMFDDVVCVDYPRKPITDTDVDAWIDSGGEYQQPGGHQCY